MIKTKEEELEELRSQYLELLSMTEYPQKQQTQQHRQQNLQLQQHQSRIVGNHQQPQPSSSQLQQNSQVHQLRLKSYGLAEASPQPVGHENLSYSPLIES